MPQLVPGQNAEMMRLFVDNIVNRLRWAMIGDTRCKHLNDLVAQ